jgi:uncharacterized protein (UPF0548 family)
VFLLREPTEAQIRRYRDREAARPFSYRAVGATAAPPPPRGWTVDHNRIRLGAGPAVWERAVGALRRWEMFHLGWARLWPPAAPITAGTTLVVVSRQAGLWALNASRIVYTLDAPGPPRRCGFAYGTLPGHAERGEERFLVEQDAAGAVWYDILAFSRPRHPLAILGFPVTRRVQRRFARDSLAAMRRAVRD